MINPFMKIYPFEIAIHIGGHQDGPGIRAYFFDSTIAVKTNKI
jgi:hypothetical protein